MARPNVKALHKMIDIIEMELGRLQEFGLDDYDLGLGLDWLYDEYGLAKYSEKEE